MPKPGFPSDHPESELARPGRGTPGKGPLRLTPRAIRVEVPSRSQPGPAAGAGSRQHAGRLEAGQRLLKRYTLKKELGRGGMGIVWLAEDEHLHESVALKFVPTEVRADAAALDDLRRETARSHRLTHPNIVRIHDFHEVEGEAAFISMEYVEGRNLAAWRVAEPGRVLRWSLLAPLVRQLCAALEYAHTEKVIHRDLKPANLMVDGKGRLKLADFGVAAVVSDSMSRVSLQKTSGTLLYMSPQQLTGRPARVTDDLYAMGATLYELLTGKPPFYTGDLVHQVLHVPAVPLEERLAESGLTNAIPPAVSAMVMACLAKDPAQRPQSAAAVAEWIGLEERRGPPQPDKPEPVPVVPPTPPPEPAEPAAGLLETPPQEQGETAPGGSREKGALLWVLSGLAVLGLMASPFLAELARVNQIGPWRRSARTAGQPLAPRRLQPDERWTNGLGMVFAPVAGTEVLFGIWETRVRDFTAFVRATSYNASPGMYSVRRDGVKQRGDTWENPGFAQGANHPVVGVSWDDAQAFCRWLSKEDRKSGFLEAGQSYRLPTDLEWSRAVGLPAESGGTPQERDAKVEGVFPWGFRWPPPPGAGNFAGEESNSAERPPEWTPILGYNDGYAHTAPVGSFSAGMGGLYDMAGNVWEWCEDYYDAARQQRTVRGGSWLCGADPPWLWSSFRYHGQPRNRHSDFGFRCVLANAP